MARGRNGTGSAGGMQSGGTPRARIGRRVGLWLAAGMVAGIVPITQAQGQASGDTGVITTDELVPSVQTIVPQRRWRRVVAPEWKPVEVKSVDADVIIEGDVARTTLAITLFNPSSRMARCELAVPVPGEAAISAFSLDGLEGDPPARLLPREEAREAFEAIVRKMIDPGQLEFAGYGLITSSVFPVPANGEQTFRVTYEHIVEGDGTSIVYELPRSASLDNAPDWDIDIAISGDRPILSAFSTTHDASVEIDDAGSATIDGKALDRPGAFRLVAMREPADGPAMSLMTYPDPEAADRGFFMLVMAAPERDGSLPGLAREVTIVLDRSGSMQGEKFVQATGAARQIINALDPNEAFRIVDYADQVASFAVDADTPEKAREALAYLESLNPVGGTNINEALLTALREPVADGTLPIVLFLTDGLPTVGVKSEHAIRENVLKANQEGGRRLFTFGVGHDVNVPLLTDLARETRGMTEFVAPEEDVEAAVGRVFANLKGPVLTDLSMGALATNDCANPIGDLFPRSMGDLYERQRVVVLGRYTACEGGLSLVITGDDASGETERTIALDPSDADPANSHIARLWAQQKITWLIDELRSAGADPSVQQLDSLREDPRLAELIDEVVRLSTTYGILTEYTSFLAAEDAMLANWSNNAQELERVLSISNQQRWGDTAVQLGQSQRARRAVTGGGGGGQSPFQSISAPPAEADAAGAASGLVLMSRGAKIADLEDRLESMTRIQTAVQSVGPDTLYNQRGRWVDANLVNADQQLENPEQDRPEPDETVAFGTDRYFAINARLAESGRQALMAVPGEVEILMDGKRILIQNPS